MLKEAVNLSDDRPGGAAPRLPADTTLTRLAAHADERGMVAEIFRATWPTGIAPVQWSTCISRAGILRGMHVHIRHDDYLCVVQGRLFVALCDLRSGSPTERMPSAFELSGENLSSLVIPHGVAHGFYACEPTTYVLGTSHYYDIDDELGFHWTDPGLDLAWPVESPELSQRDAALGTLEALLPRIRPWHHQ
ncbi:MAG TPA: dTDP-4-dehydrorhamnose 3,5-epimerase family protein [Candidatus Limnocylindrales bacterium]|nr:dTDP-4-dehydrorhamnose 3,5-epimerase family protein [Candidatus Limnocylindrales bacterium]